jgi:hypothetical protein
MKNSDKIHEHNLRRLFFDLLRDTNSSKYSMTKFAAFIGLIALFIIIMTSLFIMCQKGEVDHVLIVEVIGFVLTLLGFKNFGFIKTPNSQTIVTNGSLTTTTTTNEENADSNETGNDAEKNLISIAKPDTIDDSLKG